MLHDPSVVRKLDPNSYMQLHRDAGYTEEEVQKAGNAWANRALDNEVRREHPV